MTVSDTRSCDSTTSTVPSTAPTLCAPACLPVAVLCGRFTNTRRRFLVPFLHKLAQAAPAAVNSSETSVCESRADSPSSCESSGGSSGSGELSQWRQQRTATARSGQWLDLCSSRTAETALSELGATDFDSTAASSEAAACSEEARVGGLFAGWSDDGSLASASYAESRWPHSGMRYGGAQCIAERLSDGRITAGV